LLEYFHSRTVSHVNFFAVSNKLQVRHRRSIASAIRLLNIPLHAAKSTRPVGVPVWSDQEQVLHELFVVNESQRLPPRVKVASFRQPDHSVHPAAALLGSQNGCADLPVPQDRRGQCSQQGFPLVSRAAHCLESVSMPLCV
jgi:hypothetical protein